MPQPFDSAAPWQGSSEFVAVCREPTTSAKDRANAMRSAVDTCLQALPRKLDAVPRFVRCVAAEWLRGRSDLSESQRSLRSKLGNDLPDPRFADLQAGLLADRSPFHSGTTLKLRIDEGQPGVPPTWEGAKPSALMAGHAAAAAPVVGAARQQDASIKLLLVMQRGKDGAVRCTVVNGTGQALSDKTRKVLTEALVQQDPALKACEVEFVETSVNVASKTDPITLYSLLLRNLGDRYPLPEGDRLHDAMRTLDEYLASLEEEALRQLLACEAAWLHSVSKLDGDGGAQPRATPATDRPTSLIDGDLRYF